MLPINIAIDGPSGAGKSTLSKKLAKEFSMLYLDTGSLYRAVGLYVHQQGVDSKDCANIENLLSQINIELKYENQQQRVLLNGADVSDLIRTPLISLYASDVSAIPKVREFLFKLQRDIASKNNCIMDGRDIGTVILPHAQLKVFLTATPQERARRRFEELRAKGENVSFDNVLGDILYRDENDSKRAHAPLKAAPDAVLVDTTEIGFEESFQLLKTLIKERLKSCFIE